MTQKQKKNNGLMGINALTSCISTTFMLSMLGLITFFVLFANNFSNNLRENFSIMVYLDDDMDTKESVALQQKLKKLPAAHYVNYISKEKALEIQTKALNSDPSEFADNNPLPAAFEVFLKAEYANTDSLKTFLPQLEKYPKVDEVQYPKTTLDTLDSALKKISSVLVTIALLLALVSFVLINNTIRLSVYSRRFLINTMKLVGANWSFIRRPFMEQALCIGMIAAVLATCIDGACIYAFVQFEPKAEALISGGILASTVGVIFVCGILLTLLCAYFTVNRILQMKSNHLHRY